MYKKPRKPSGLTLLPEAAVDHAGLSPAPDEPRHEPPPGEEIVQILSQVSPPTGTPAYLSEGSPPSERSRGREEIGGLPVAKHLPIYFSEDGSVRMEPLRVPDTSAEPVFHVTTTPSAAETTDSLCGYGGTLHAQIPIAFIDIRRQPEFEEEQKKRLEDDQDEAKKKGWNLGKLVGGLPSVAMIEDNPVRTLLPAKDTAGIKMDKGLNFAGPLQFGLIPTYIVYLKMITLVFRRSSSGPRRATLYHELVHALQNMSDTDFEGDAGLDDEAGHDAKNSLAAYLSNLVGGVNPWAAWIGLTVNSSAAQLSMINAMASEWGIEAPGLGGKPPPEKPKK